MMSCLDETSEMQRARKRTKVCNLPGVDVDVDVDCNLPGETVVKQPRVAVARLQAK